MEKMYDNVLLNCAQNRVSEATVNSLSSVQTIALNVCFPVTSSCSICPTSPFPPSRNQIPLRYPKSSRSATSSPFIAALTGQRPSCEMPPFRSRRSNGCRRSVLCTCCMEANVISRVAAPHDCFPIFITTTKRSLLSIRSAAVC